LKQSIPHGRLFLIRDYIHKFCYNNDYSTTAKTYLTFSTIAKIAIGCQKLTKKDKIEDQKNLLANFIFLKVVVIYAMLLAGIILHHKLILCQQFTV